MTHWGRHLRDCRRMGLVADIMWYIGVCMFAILAILVSIEVYSFLDHVVGVCSRYAEGLLI